MNSFLKVDLKFDPLRSNPPLSGVAEESRLFGSVTLKLNEWISRGQNSVAFTAENAEKMLPVTPFT